MGSVTLKRVLLLVLLVQAFVALAIVGMRVNRPAQAQHIACADPVQTCVFTHRGQPAQLRFIERPTTMQPFKIELHTADANRVSAEFQMVGMDMGVNRYNFRAASPGLFRAAITLPVCVSGRRDWKMFLAIDDVLYMVPFHSQ